MPTDRAVPPAVAAARSPAAGHQIFYLRVAVSLAVTVFVLATRAWLIRDWASPLPYLDQWDAESALYRGWLTGTLRWADLFAAHNEHRIALTRFADLALFIICDGWNPWAQLLLNAALHAATAGLLVVVFWPALQPRARALFALGTTVLFSATSGWQNALWGFQSQVYFTNLFAVAGLAGFALASPGTRHWWLASGALALGCFGNASGLLAALAAIALFRLQHSARITWISALTLAAIISLGLALRVTVPAHGALQARSIAQFFAVFARGLGWPHLDSAWAWMGLQLPLALLCLHRWRQRIGLDARERCAVALCLYGMLHAAAVAYGRGAGLFELRLLSRYQDPLLLGVAAQFFAALRLATAAGRPGRLLALGWTALVLTGLLQLASVNFSLHLPFKRAQDRLNLAGARAYLRTGDTTVFQPGDTLAGVHPDPTAVKRVLDDPVLRPVLENTLGTASIPPWPVVHAPALTGLATLLLLATLAISLRVSDRPHASMPPRARP